MKHNRLPRSLTGGPEALADLALVLFGIIAAAVTVVAIIESYSNLLAFASVHHMSGWRLAMAPLAADSFIIMGELLMLAALLKHVRVKTPYIVGGAFAVWGFLLSVGGNVWHVPSAAPVDKALGAIWPVTATAGMAGGLIIIKFVMSRRGAGATVVPEATAVKPPPAPLEPQPVPAGRAARVPELAVASERDAAIVLDLRSRKQMPGINKAAKEFGIGAPRARRLILEARAGSNGTGHL